MTGIAALRMQGGLYVECEEFCMERSGKKRWIRLSVMILVSAAIALMIAVSRGLSLKESVRFNACCLSDGFFVVGFLMAGMGALIWISTTGFFDMMSYAVRSFLVLFTPLKKPKEHPGYVEYKEARDARRGKPRFGLLVVGVVYLVLSALCLGIYYG